MKLLNKRGSAILWAVCAMMLLSFVIASLLAVSVSYYNQSMVQVTEKRAEFIARSGINYAIEKVEDGRWTIDIPSGNTDDVHKTLQFDEADKGKIEAKCDIVLSVKTDNSQPGYYAVMKATSTAVTKDGTLSVAALFVSKDGTQWKFYGYIED